MLYKKIQLKLINKKNINMVKIKKQVNFYYKNKLI